MKTCEILEGEGGPKSMKSNIDTFRMASCAIFSKKPGSGLSSKGFMILGLLLVLNRPKVDINCTKHHVSDTQYFYNAEVFTDSQYS